jgi:hypothetical protein
MTLGTVGLSCLGRRYGITPQRILALRRWSTVKWITATASTIVAEKVVQLHALGDRADLPLVANAVDKNHPAGNADPPVPGNAIALPDIATIGIGDPTDIRGVFATALTRNAPCNEARIDCHTIQTIHG